MKVTYFAALMLLAGCTGPRTMNNFQMDYPVEAARLSLGGDVSASINCSTREINILSDSSNGIFSRHIQKRLSNICYKKNNKMTVHYYFTSEKGVRQNMLATQHPRIPPQSYTHKPGNGDS